MAEVQRRDYVPPKEPVGAQPQERVSLGQLLKDAVSVVHHEMGTKPPEVADDVVMELQRRLAGGGNLAGAPAIIIPKAMFLAFKLDHQKAADEAHALFKAGNHDQAIAVLKKYIEANPKQGQKLLDGVIQRGDDQFFVKALQDTPLGDALSAMALKERGGELLLHAVQSGNVKMLHYLRALGLNIKDVKNLSQVTEAARLHPEINKYMNEWAKAASPPPAQKAPSTPRPKWSADTSEGQILELALNWVADSKSLQCKRGDKNTFKYEFVDSQGTKHKIDITINKDKTISMQVKDNVGTTKATVSYAQAARYLKEMETAFTANTHIGDKEKKAAVEAVQKLQKKL